MKKCLLLLFLFTLTSFFFHIPAVTNSVSTSYDLNKKIFRNSHELLELFEDLVKRQREKTIVLLSKSETKDDQNRANLLKNKRFIDHIRVDFENKTIHFQLNDNRTPRILLNRAPQKDKYQQEKIEKAAQDLFEKLPDLFKATVNVYLSPNYRKEQTTSLQLFLGPTLKDDLYSASISIHVE